MTIKEIKEGIKSQEDREFRINYARFYCSPCGVKFSETEIKDIIKRDKAEFELIKSSNIRWLKALFKEKLEEKL